MAEAQISALAVISPVAQRNPAAQNAAQQAEQNGQPSFSQVLKSRSQAAEAPAASASKPSEKTDKAERTEPAEPTDKADAAAEAAAQPVQPALIDPALLLAAAGLNPAAAAPVPGANAQQNLDGDARLGAAPNAELPSEAPVFAVSTAALAAQSASLAGKTASDSSTPQSESASASPATLLAQADGKPLSGQAQTQSEAQGDREGRPELVKTEFKTEPETLASVQGRDAQNTFASELANAAQNQNIETAAPNTHGVLAAAHGDRANAAVPQHEITTPVAARGWAEEVGQKVSWIAKGDNGKAEIVLTPPSMGRVEVSITMNGDQASASFVTASPAAREALQDAMPRLREVLAQAGIHLGQADVNTGSSHQAQSDNPNNRSGNSRFAQSGERGLNSLEGISAGRADWTPQGRGMIDTFA